MSLDTPPRNAGVSSARPSVQSPAPSKMFGSAGGPRSAAGASSATRRTLLALAASALAALPLQNLLTDVGWLVDVWLTMIIVIGPAVLLRHRRAPGALDVWPGILLLVPWLTARFVSAHAFAGCLPTRASLHDIAVLMSSLHHTTRYGVAPVHSTVAVRLVLCALLGLLAALVDLIGVVGRRGALAGVPILVVFTIAGAVSRQPVSWVWFAVAASGYLLLLGLDAQDELYRWGRQVTRKGSGRNRFAGVVSGERVGVLAIVLAIIVPVLVPMPSRNLITDLIRHGGSGGGSGSGDGTSISPFANLRGQLNRQHPIDLATVHMLGAPAKRPAFYLRSNVLDEFTGSGWRVSDHGPTQPTFDSALETIPASSGDLGAPRVARITVSSLGGAPPLFAQPRSFLGLDHSATWSPQDELLLGASVHPGDSYIETFQEPAPSAADLSLSIGRYAEDMSRWTALPDLPASITTLVTRLTADKKTPYAKARAISNYFADPLNGFTYSLRTKDGDSRTALVDFLSSKVGFCQQYAAAMAVLLRKAGVPSRVVLGYMHPEPDEKGDFTVTSFDAHAWVEAYFKNIGWLPFDPTPVDGLDGGPASDLNYAPHAYPSGADRLDPHGKNTLIPHGSSSGGPSSPTVAPVAVATRSTAGPNLWVLAAILGAALLCLLPAGVRQSRRRRRLAAGRAGDPDQLWAELSDTAVDLGYVWSLARSPRQVAAWLARDTDDPHALDALTAAVERHRYGGPDTGAPADVAVLTDELAGVSRALRQRRSGRTRLLAWLWPASLGLRGRLPGPGRRRR